MAKKINRVQNHSLFTDFDVALFQSGKHFRLYEKMGAKPMKKDGEDGVYFCVYAPAATSVRVIGDFNFWSGDEHELYVRWDSSGIWEGFIPGIGIGTLYKYRINSENGQFDKADPYARFAQHRPDTASIVYADKYRWRDKKWMDDREVTNSLKAPMSIYEMHLGSWVFNSKRNQALSYRELGRSLVSYLQEMGFTHVEFMPVMEYPYDPSWGYQITGYYAPTSRYGEPKDLKYLINKLHQAGIGVILDWVPSHFPEDGHGLAKFDGSAVYEHPDRKKGFHPDWESLIFNYERAEVRSFLISNALYWLEEYHIDGLRVDAVASMLYLDYSREEGQWEPNIHGGREYLAAIEFLKDFNKAVYEHYPAVQTIAEESTAFPKVSHPVHEGGLGFGMKWMMGWMHDTLDYFKTDPLYRSHHHTKVSFSIYYAFTENFVLPLSHDEVVHGKGSLIYKVPGDEWQRFANLRLLYSYMYTHPGAKMLFMGGEFAQTSEWNFARALDWNLLDYDPHKGIQTLVKDLNNLYRSVKPLYERNYDWQGFEWIDFNDHENCVLSYLRIAEDGERVLVVCNFTPVVRKNYKIGVPRSRGWMQIFNSNDERYWGSGDHSYNVLTTKKGDQHGRDRYVQLDLPPLAAILFSEIKGDHPDLEEE